MVELTPETVAKGPLWSLRDRLFCEMSTRVAMLLMSAWLGWSPPASADDRPPGIPEEARYAKVDRVIDAVVVMAVFAVAVDDDAESNYSHYFGSAPKLSYAVSLRGL